MLINKRHLTPEALERQLQSQARMALFLASDDTMCTANNYTVEAGAI